jgi:NTE family protein
MTETSSERRAIGLALSGGGVRAAAFHAGALRRLAEIGGMREVIHVSTVSGGSLFTGLVFHFSGYKWPTDEQYLRDVLPQVRALLTTSSLQWNALFRLLALPCNWQFLTSRANVVAQSLSKDWGIGATLSSLPSNPVWSINGSCSESGRRFRFKSGEIGDYESGYAQAPNLPLAAAMAVSAAFPGGIGPLAIRTDDYIWTKKIAWNDETPEPHIPQFRKLHLYDGGVYDNLGLEPLFDMGKQELRQPENRIQKASAIGFLLVSDAGLGYARQTLPHPLNPLRLKRVADLAFDQIRALRVRSLMNYLKHHPGNGALLPIGFAAPHGATVPVSGAFLKPEEATAAACVKTSLTCLSVEQFRLVERHGYETAHWATQNLLTYEKPI